MGLNGFHIRTNKKMKILGAVLELPAKQHCQSSPFGPNWPNWQCCLAGSSKTAPRIFIFSIVLGAKYLSYVKSIETRESKRSGENSDIFTLTCTYPKRFKTL